MVFAETSDLIINQRIFSVNAAIKIPNIAFAMD